MHVFLLTILGLLFTAGLRAETIKAEKVSGHISPMMVKVTFRDSSVRTGLLRGIGQSNGHFKSHQFIGLDHTGSESSVWLDTISQIRPISNDEGSFAMKDGSTLKLKYSVGSATPSRYLYIVRSDGGHDKVDLLNVRFADFLRPARVDMKGFAMFDQWEFSPYTGEPLGKQVSRR